MRGALTPFARYFARAVLTWQMSHVLSLPLAVVRALELSLGADAHVARTEPVVIDLVGWSFWWRRQAGVAAAVDQGLADELSAFGKAVGATLRRLLPRVSGVKLRGVGPEALDLPRVNLTSDGWLTLETRRRARTAPRVLCL